MGILDRSTQGGVVHQLAVELDPFMNEFDIDGNHVGIDTTNTMDPVDAKSLNNIGVNLKSGKDIKVRIDYDGYNHELQISVAYSGNSLISVLNHSIKMSEIVPSHVYVGFSGGTGVLPGSSHKVFNWAFSSFPLSSAEDRLRRDNRIQTILILVVPSVMTVLFIMICVYLVNRAPGKRDKKDTDIESQSREAANVPRMFTCKELAKATRNFSKENLLGTGGFGSVYKGVISDPPVEIAVKKIFATSKQGLFLYLCHVL
ncbi:probable L-type lectin-domain containing receptor kinase II.1 [Eucalyptus grandis]|uniref:probable L-type lectin-domain containing receptor kinase II.1 n=1 Tax=Eucalyptus grandis TaxID=71139 RepID=UPI00192E944E|nr:probable L-type lectin-domain containing receptor kinase II.1 [Eucalyptus grandis]